MLLSVGVGTGVTSSSTGGMATVNEVTSRAVLAFPAESVTVTVQLEYGPSSRTAPLGFLKVTVLLSASAEVSELLQPPAYVMVPASVELNV